MANNKENYDGIADEIYHLRELKTDSEVDSVKRDEELSRITEMQDFIKSQPDKITERDEKLVNRMIEKITFFDDSFSIEFKSGVKVDVKE